MAVKYVSVCVCVYICDSVCFTNWTGIVVEVKRGQLKRERQGDAEKELAGGLGL